MLNKAHQHNDNAYRCLHLKVFGAVQGMGFRPFIYRLSHELGLKGWVKNCESGVVIEVEGPLKDLETFMARLQKENPPLSIIQKYEHSFLEPKGFESFLILESVSDASSTTAVLSDLAMCSECAKEINDPNNRRYLYPFTTCTYCGPRYSIIERLPYDRINTSMKEFKMCAACQSEYDDPSNRRFHAQTNACCSCGPQLELRNKEGEVLARHQDALEQAALFIEKGLVVAIKGLGGFHLAVDARNQTAVDNLRKRKHRPHQPLAVMFPDLTSLLNICSASEEEQELLTSPQAPIVLLNKKTNNYLAENIASANPYIGAMLPYTPLHHILLNRLQFPIVATSGNVSEEPICIDNEEAVERLSLIADYFLVHDRLIIRQVDDSVVQRVAGRSSILRRSRGFSPFSIQVRKPLPVILAVGAHQKNTVALSINRQTIVSQHIGNLDNPQTLETFQRTINTLREVYDSPLEYVVCDKHPDYISTRYAQTLNVPVRRVQHHFAHVASCMLDNEIEENVLGICWDGTGYGLDGTIWGGEFIEGNLNGFKRTGFLKQFPLPGSELAVKEPRRSALGLLYAFSEGKLKSFRDLNFLQAFTGKELEILEKMLEQRINCPMTSSMGRFFDAVASLLDLQQKVSFEGQAAMALEFLAAEANIKESYAHAIMTPSTADDCFVIDWSSMVGQMIKDVSTHVPAAQMAAMFHNTLIDIIVAVAKRVKQENVVLTGGCFQNKYLCEEAVRRLQEQDFKVFWHSRLPANDGGIALGQAAIAGFTTND